MMAACRAAGRHARHRLHDALSPAAPGFRAGSWPKGRSGGRLQARAQYGFLLKPDRQTWRVDRGRLGGGPLMDVGSHAIDLLCYVTGAR